MKTEWFLSHIETGKANAKRDRERGGSTVRVFKSAEARERSYGPRCELDRLEDEYNHWRREIQLDCLAAVEHAVFADLYKDFLL